ncbi:hypothetical protein JOD29_003813 [Lysinibacillus composti]|nr:hypothetical protein [Lysinibacillus composti]
MNHQNYEYDGLEITSYIIVSTLLTLVVNAFIHFY